jgi:uncharacterized protein (TIGR03435 family)
MRFVVLLILALLAFAQMPEQLPGNRPSGLKFEVATIKPAAPGQQISGLRPTPGGERYIANNATLATMLMAAYRVRPDQITGGPEWAYNEAFDMNAKAEKPASADDLHAMLVNLLMERFQLKLHREKRDMARYVLAVDKAGPKLTPHAATNGSDPWIELRFERLLQVTMNAKSCPMQYLAFRLSVILDRPIVDSTGLQEDYDFDLSFTRDLPPGIPETAQLNGAPLDTSGPTVFAVMKQQLGLELKAGKGPVDVIVIDSASRLAAN